MTQVNNFNEIKTGEIVYNFVKVKTSTEILLILGIMAPVLRNLRSPPNYQNDKSNLKET